MIKTGNISYFTIKESGLYSYGKNSRKIGSNSVEIFDALFSWLKDRPFPDTSPWEDAKTAGKRGVIYCQDKYFDEKNSAYAFVLWKSEVKGKDKNLYGIPANNHDDVVVFDGKHNGQDVIWGRPCYYMVFPKEERIVSIKFDDSLCDKDLFCDWVSRVVSLRAKKFPYRVVEKNDDGSETIKLKVGDRLAHIRFEARLLYNPSTFASFKKFARDVTGIVYKEKISLSAGVNDRPRWLELFNKVVPYIGVREKEKARQVYIEVDANPTAEEMQIAFENHLEAMGNDEEPSMDLGFLRSKGMPTIWANDYRVKSQVTLEKNTGIFKSKELYERVLEDVKENIALGPVEDALLDQSGISSETTNIEVA